MTIYNLDLLLSWFGTSLLFPCPVLTVASWPAYRFLRRQVRWSGIPISLRIFHSLLWSTQSKAYDTLYAMLNCFSCVWLFATYWLWSASLLCPWDFPGKNTVLGILGIPMGSSGIWSEVKNTSPRVLPYISLIGIQPTSLTSPALAVRFFTTGATWEA